ncbi:MAG: hypothetical protein JRC86_13145 [Deltaproteobacteria bacterium]|nr:hypothetical protein [Deltaproteobacteria bacterium]
MKQLFIGGMDGISDEEVRAHIASEWGADAGEEVAEYEILIALRAADEIGKDPREFYFLRNKKDGKFSTVYGSFCPVMGFDNQFDPHEVTIEKLMSDEIIIARWCCGDTRCTYSMEMINFIAELGGKNESE